jgi:CheY-like chemotaxis protein
MKPTFVAPRTILLIDDHAAHRQVLAQVLRAAGHHVMEADGVDAHRAVNGARVGLGHGQQRADGLPGRT